MATSFAIHNEADYRRALDLISELWDVSPDSPDAEVLDVMATLVSLYEQRSRSLPPPDPLALVAFKLRELGWSQRELGRRLGWGTGRVCELLNKKRPLTQHLIQDLARLLNLPVASLSSAAPRDTGSHVWVRVERRLVDRLEGRDIERLVGSLLQDHPARNTVSSIVGCFRTFASSARGHLATSVAA